MAAVRRRRTRTVQRCVGITHHRTTYLEKKRSRLTLAVGSKGDALNSYFRTRSTATASTSEIFEVAQTNAGNNENKEGAKVQGGHSPQDDSIGAIIDLVSAEDSPSIAIHPIMLDTEQFPSASTKKATIRRQLTKRSQLKKRPRMKSRTRTNTEKSACCVAGSQR